jgi:hypothetical protein
MTDKSLILALDFDGTICKHAEYPAIGEPVPGALDWIWKFHKAGAKSFLWTCRDGQALDNALAYLHSNFVVLDGVNHYEYWDGFKTSRKLFANIYIDDAAACAPLWYPDGCTRPCLDWAIVGPHVLDRINSGLRA